VQLNGTRLFLWSTAMRLSSLEPKECYGQSGTSI
jgi:hypothetical protein